MGLLEPLNTRISLEMTGDTKLYMVSAKQGDKATRYVVAELSNNGERYSIPQGAYAVVNIIKPDGKKVYNDCVYNESEVIFELTNQILAAAGTAYCDIQIRTKDEEQILTSATFTIEIEKTMRDDSAILSSDEFTFFEKSMLKVKEITESLDNAKINFVEAKERENINTSDTFGVILGKLEKIVGDLKEVAFSGEYKDIKGTPKKLGDFVNDVGYVTTDTDTWKANTAESEGYVPATGGMANRIYGTDDEGNPVWKEGADIDIDIKPDFTGTLDELNAAMEDGSAPVDTIAFVENDTEFEADDFLLPEDRVLVTGPDGVYPSETTAQELEYLSGVTGNVQDQIDIIGIVLNSNNKNAIVRCKSLGASVTPEQIAAIRDGSFKDLFLGDYWTINGVNWRIWDFNYWLHCGSTTFEKNHAVILPDKNLYNQRMNASNTTVGGYIGSEMYKSGLDAAKTTIANAFGNLVLSHKEILTNTVANGIATAGAWVDSTVELPNEIMMYGSHIFASVNNGTTVPYGYTIDKSQLSLARLRHDFVDTRESYWLRDVVSASKFANVYGSGSSNNSGAADILGVRPVFCIG